MENFDEARAREFGASMGREIRYVHLLKKGPCWSAESTPDLDVLQKAHVDSMQRLSQAGKPVVSGSLLDAFQLGGEIRCVGVVQAGSLIEAQQVIGTAPMVKAGHLEFEVHAWMVPGGVLPQPCARPGTVRP